MEISSYQPTRAGPEATRISTSGAQNSITPVQFPLGTTAARTYNTPPNVFRLQYSSTHQADRFFETSTAVACASQTSTKQQCSDACRTAALPFKRTQSVVSTHASQATSVTEDDIQPIAFGPQDSNACRAAIAPFEGIITAAHASQATSVTEDDTQPVTFGLAVTHALQATSVTEDDTQPIHLALAQRRARQANVPIEGNVMVALASPATSVTEDDTQPFPILRQDGLTRQANVLVKANTATARASQACSVTDDDDEIIPDSQLEGALFDDQESQVIPNNWVIDSIAMYLS